MQFGAGEDLDAYPRTLDSDVELLRSEGVEIVFAPNAAEMYPAGQRTTVLPGPLGAGLEGGARPSHFAGMLTVVLKLLQIVRPDRAYFGEKDYQQLVLVRQMVDDLNVDVRIVAVPIVRESDGLALSSRNRYLDDGTARTGRRAVGGAAGRKVRGRQGCRGGVGCRARGAEEVPSIDVDYLEVRVPGLEPAPDQGSGPAAGGGPARQHQIVGQHRH